MHTVRTLLLNGRAVLLTPHRREHLNELLAVLETDVLVRGILLGGSTSYKNSIEKSDIDLFCLIDNTEAFEATIQHLPQVLEDIDAIIYQGYFLWTEKLYTLFYEFDLDFSIDICLVASQNVDTFFWEPNGHIILDKDQSIDKYRTLQVSHPEFTAQPFLKHNPFSLAVVTLKKIEKNLSRKHLWNALEQLGIMRRYTMQIIRLNLLQDKNFLGRVDRDIEDVLSPEMNEKLTKTIAEYDAADIAANGIKLTEIAKSLLECLDDSKEGYVRDWIVKQFEHEIQKLRTYIA